MIQQEGTTRTALLAAAVPLLAVAGLAMADDLHVLTVETVQDVDEHDTTQVPWGYCTSETLRGEHIHTCATLSHSFPTPLSPCLPRRGPLPLQHIAFF